MGSLKIRKWLENKDLDIHKADKDFRTPVHYAALKGQIPILEYLLKDANPVHLNTLDKYRMTPLISAARGGHVSTIDFLLKFEVVRLAINQPCDYERTPFLHAVKLSNIEDLLELEIVKLGAQKILMQEQLSTKKPAICINLE